MIALIGFLIFFSFLFYLYLQSFEYKVHFNSKGLLLSAKIFYLPFVFFLVMAAMASIPLASMLEPVASTKKSVMQTIHPHNELMLPLIILLIGSIVTQIFCFKQLSFAALHASIALALSITAAIFLLPVEKFQDLLIAQNQGGWHLFNPPSLFWSILIAFNGSILLTDFRKRAEHEFSSTALYFTFFFTMILSMLITILFLGGGNLPAILIKNATLLNLAAYISFIFFVLKVIVVFTLLLNINIEVEKNIFNTIIYKIQIPIIVVALGLQLIYL